MNKIWIISLMISLVLLVSCTQANNNSNINTNESSNNNYNYEKKNTVPTLTEEQALKIASEGNIKFNVVIDFGSQIPGNTFENKKPIEINGEYYYYFGGSLDTLKKFKNYLIDTFTNKSIESIMKSLGIIVHEEKLLGIKGDIGEGLNWDYAEIVSLTQNDDTANVEMKVPFMGDDVVYYNKQTPFRYIQNQGWRIDTELPFDLY